METIENTKIKVKLLGTDGNAFSILGKVSREMRRHKIPQETIDRYTSDAMAGDYDNLLAVTMQYVDVE